MNPIANRICLIIANKQNLRFCFLTEKICIAPYMPATSINYAID